MTSDVAYLWRLRGHMTGSIHWDPALCTFDSKCNPKNTLKSK